MRPYLNKTNIPLLKKVSFFKIESAILEGVNFVVIVNSNIILQVTFLKEFKSETKIQTKHQFDLDNTRSAHVKEHS